MEQEKDLKTRELVINMGPQHPSTHGVLRLKLNVDGETVVKCTPYVGYLHRGTEKLAETMTYIQVIPLTDRLDYISSMTNNVGYCLAVERLFDINVPLRAKYIRTLVSELSRMSSHLLWLATHALDIGAMTVFLYAFREREGILDLFETLTGARLTVSYPRIGGVKRDVTQEFIDKTYAFAEDFPQRIQEYETLIDVNRIWLKRTLGVGAISAEDAINWGFSGATLRGCGVNYDVRKRFPYDAYDLVEFDVPVGKNGDVYDRYLCRVEELRQSTRIVKQCIEALPRGPIMAPDAPKFTLPAKDKVLGDMESLIHHFMLITKGPMTAPKGEIYVAIEAPKGELGFYIVSDGTGKPYRMRIRSPSFVHVSALPRLCEGRLLADVVANIGTIDVVLGECDR
ncbi:MAG: NADH dehydrogenase (quinone) subunit D [Nitrospirae bacterium]|nr:NADH dehydrogenase (quinone) subunit D [Nitrospirota bacterium]MBF0592058.1 NADH dehydrogenase (quinone) subunit D [Nitrospirota bacterium]